MQAIFVAVVSFYIEKSLRAVLQSSLNQLYCIIYFDYLNRIEMYLFNKLLVLLVLLV